MGILLTQMISNTFDNAKNKLNVKRLGVRDHFLTRDEDHLKGDIDSLRLQAEHAEARGDMVVAEACYKKISNLDPNAKYTMSTVAEIITHPLNIIHGKLEELHHKSYKAKEDEKRKADPEYDALRTQKEAELAASNAMHGAANRERVNKHWNEFWDMKGVQAR